MSHVIGARFHRSAASWRTVDIVVVAVIAAVFGAVYWALGQFSSTALFSVFPPLAAVVNVVFVMAGPLGALIIRRPGAALAAELLAAVFEAMVSAAWSASTIVEYGLVQGIAAEVVFALVAYRRWSLDVALASGAVAGACMATVDIWISRYYAYFPLDQKLAYLTLCAVAGAVVVGALSWFIVRALAETGVLAPFASGREQERI